MSAPKLDPVRLARVRELAQAEITTGAAYHDAVDADEKAIAFDAYDAAATAFADECSAAFILSLLEGQEDTKRLEWLADNATSASDGYGPDGISMDPMKATHGRVLLCRMELPTVPRETKDWFRAAIDAAIAEDAADLDLTRKVWPSLASPESDV